MLELENKSISSDTVEAMRDAVGKSYDYYNSAVDEIKKILPSDEVHILNSANSCILTVLEAIPEPILVADQGGWNGFNKMAWVMKKKVEEIETREGIINIEELDKYLTEHDVKSLYITSMSAYTARQPIEEINKLCNIHEIIFILDTTPTIGAQENKNIADLQITSTGTPKILNIENGGIIANNTKKIQLNKDLIKTLKADNITCAGIKHEIHKTPQILQKTLKTNTYLKQQLQKQLPPENKIIHQDKEGLNTIITTKSKKKAKTLAYQINKEINTKPTLIKTGPQYNRIKKPSIIIETKNIAIKDLTKENMDKLSKIILEKIRQN
ncbi:MAG: hypothetical protein BZ136_05870 [Methanosphaera sp. rholeuAM74]|nr:MAG: hypothetical protein BZ136_05870 [Methanosphaera sp. rholeuAM74]